jgi:hypothetical protein
MTFVWGGDPTLYDYEPLRASFVLAADGLRRPMKDGLTNLSFAVAAPATDLAPAVGSARRSTQIERVHPPPDPPPEGVVPRLTPKELEERPCQKHTNLLVPWG